MMKQRFTSLAGKRNSDKNILVIALGALMLAFYSTRPTPLIAEERTKRTPPTTAQSKEGRSSTATSVSKISTSTILESFVDSYKHDPMALTAIFGIQIGEEWWHVRSTRHQEGYGTGRKYTFHRFGPHDVTLHKGKPEKPTWYFKMPDRDVLDKIYMGIWNAGTASMRSTPSDIVALDDGVMDGFKSNQQVTATIYQVGEHFWKKGSIEITDFSHDHSLPTHGVGAVSLYTMKDKRIAWFSMLKDEAANADPRLEEGQVPNLVIFTRGKGKAHIADQEMEVHAGMSVFIGPYTKHVIYNPYDDPLEGILVLFGDNIDFATGQSYLDFLEQQYHFLEVNEREIDK